MWLSPATLELYHITWDDSASLLENIVAYEVPLAGRGERKSFRLCCKLPLAKRSGKSSECNMI
ncbi:hypothetical protein YC2023_107481 [Brassica napus]